MTVVNIKGITAKPSQDVLGLYWRYAIHLCLICSHHASFQRARLRFICVVRTLMFDVVLSIQALMHSQTQNSIPDQVQHCMFCDAPM